MRRSTGERGTDMATPDLTLPWQGPYGGLPPLDIATPEAIATAAHRAIEAKRAEIAAIISIPSPPDFPNTVEALEDAGRALKRVQALAALFNSNKSLEGWTTIGPELALLFAEMEDEIAHNDGLFARLCAVDTAGLEPDQKRLTELLIDRMKRRGAGLPPERLARLAAVNGEIARLTVQFNQNLVADQTEKAVFVVDEAELAGYPPVLKQAAARAADARGKPGQWAIANARPAVWPLLQTVSNRSLREKVWRMWTTRGGNDGPHDNRPVISAILKARAERAQLLGFESYAHYATANRMAKTPEAASRLLRQVWDAVLPVTEAQIAQMQAEADSDGAGFALMPWDRPYYAERLRRRRFGLEAEAVKPYLTLDNVIAALFHEAERLHGMTFAPLADAPTIHPDVRAWLVLREGKAIGILYFDLINREGKMQGSWQFEIRTHEQYRGEVLPISQVNSGLMAPSPGEPVTMGWEYANVLFHEFGHAMHMLLSRAAYPSLGPCTVPWDFVEVPALLNERWLFDRDLIRRFLKHHETGEPMPEAMIDAIEAGLKFDRVFSVNLDYLSLAILDIRLHEMAGADDIDCVAVEREVLAELGMPQAMDQLMAVTNAMHIWSESYAAGVYSYLWADVIVADIAAVFMNANGGFYDPEVASRYRDTILTNANIVPVDEAFRRFKGRDPAPDALMRRFDLAA